MKKETNGNVAKTVYEVMFDRDVDPRQYVEEQGLKTVKDEGALRRAVEKVMAQNPQSVADYRGGKEKALGFLVGQTMKAMKGKASTSSCGNCCERIRPSCDSSPEGGRNSNVPTH